MILRVVFSLFLVFSLLDFAVTWTIPKDVSAWKKQYTYFQEKLRHPSYEDTQEYWFSVGQKIVQKNKKLTLNRNKAKNVILFLGDGMSIATSTLTRIYRGGEKYDLSFDQFPHTALLKTYCLDLIVPESTCTATAYLTGVKANSFTSGVTGNVKVSDCKAERDPKNQASSIASWSQEKNKRTGFVTTARVTHASVAALYAHSSSRNYENDVTLHGNEETQECVDIAKQLIRGEVGKRLNVIMGGGRSNFLPKNKADNTGRSGKRMDGVDLLEEWQNNKNPITDHYIWNRTQLLNLREDTEHVLGLFETSHMKFHHEAHHYMQPDLSEMTEAAIKILDKGDEGFFLFVEGALIDMAHHQNQAKAAVNEAAEMDKAIRRALEMTDERETLIIVMADHSHTVSFGGDTLRGADVFDLAVNLIEAEDNLPISTITYSNGPGYRIGHNGRRYDLNKDKFGDFNFKYPALSPSLEEAHGGDDVAAYAKGPWSHLFSGVMEQNAIAHLMAYASCVGDGQTACEDFDFYDDSGSSLNISSFVLILCLLKIVFML